MAQLTGRDGPPLMLRPRIIAGMYLYRQISYPMTNSLPLFTGFIFGYLVYGYMNGTLGSTLAFQDLMPP